MIFLTLGTQLPFDRLVRALDKAAKSLSEPAFGQIGHSKYRPEEFEATAFLSPSDFVAHLESARVVVGHAGIGTILSGMKTGKPLLLMARRADLGEHRNDHQLATAEQVKGTPGIYIVEDEQDIAHHLRSPRLVGLGSNASPARTRLTNALSDAIFGCELPRSQ